MHLVAFHGYPLDRRLWDPARRACRRRYAGFDHRRFRSGPPRPGHVASPRRARARMSLLADDMAEEISHAVPAGEAFLLAGLSMGGYVAFEFVKRHAARFRGRLLGLALFDTKASSDDDATRAKRKEAIESIRKDGIEAALSAMLPKLLARSSKGKPVEEIARAMILATPPETAMADLAGLALRGEGFDVLAGWDQPLLVVVGDEDAIAPPSDAEAMTAVAGRASWVSLVTVPRAGHLVPLENPAEAADALVSLAARAEAGTR